MWLDRNGNEADITNYRKAYPVKEPYAGVQKFYTKVPHKENSLTAGSINNNVWKEAVTVNESLYPYEENKMIGENQNLVIPDCLKRQPGQWRMGTVKRERVENYNYDKFLMPPDCQP